MNFKVEILSCSPVLSPYIEYYKFISGTIQGAFKMVPFINQELYFSLNPGNYCIKSPGKYEVRDPMIFMTGLHEVGQEIHTFIPEDRELQSFVIVFKPNGIQKLFGLSSSEIQRYSIDCTELFRRKAGIYLEQLNQSPDYYGIRDIFENLLTNYIDNDRVDPVFQSMTEFIKEKKGHLSVGVLAEIFHITPRTLQRRFKDEFGISPKSYMQAVRINRAVELMSSGSYGSLSELAYFSGYYDQSHFIRDVRRSFGTLPGTIEKEKSILECDNIRFASLD